MIRKPYPAYKSSGVEWLGDIPEGWTCLDLKYVATANDDDWPETTAPETEILYVDIGSVDGTSGIRSKEPMLFDVSPSRARRRVANGDVIVSTVRTYLRAIAPIRDPEPNLTVSTGFAVIRPRKVDPDFLAHSLTSSYFVESVVSISTGVSYPATNPGDILNLPLPFPPEPEQTQISAFLDRETAKIDELIAKKRELIERLKEKRTALISHVVTKGLPPEEAAKNGLPVNPPLKPSGVPWLGDIPKHWEVSKLKRCVSCLDGKRIPLNSEERAQMRGDIPYWGANGIVDFVSEWIFNEPLVLLGEDGAPFFQKHKTVAFLVDGKVWVNNHAHVLRVNSLMRRELLCHQLNITQFGSFIDGSTRDKLTQSDMGDIPIVIPSPMEQRLIVEYLGHRLSIFETLINATNSVIEQLQEYRSALITAAVTGKIDVREEASA